MAKTGIELANQLINPKITQRKLTAQYGDYLKEHPENIKWGEPNEYGDQDLEWDKGAGFLQHIGYKGTYDDWQKQNPGLSLYFAYNGGIERNDPERIDYLKKNGKDWYWSLGYDDIDDLSDEDMERIEKYYSAGNGPDLDALRERRRLKADPAVQKLKEAGWSDERIAAAEKGIKEKHPEKLLGSKSRFAQKYPDRFADIKAKNLGPYIFGKGKSEEDYDWDAIAEAFGVEL